MCLQRFGLDLLLSVLVALKTLNNKTEWVSALVRLTF